MLPPRRRLGLSCRLHRARRTCEHRPIRATLIQPSVDPTVIAMKHERHMPRSIRTLLRTMGAYEARGGLLVSYLLFDKSYTCELMTMGYADAHTQRAEIVPYLAPWVT